MAGRSAARRGAIASALSVALDGLPVDTRDGAAVALAVRLAVAVDTVEDSRSLGDLSLKLLSALTALGLTPAARAAIQKGEGAIGEQSRPDTLSVLRSRSSQRAGLRAAPDLDPSAS